LSLFMEETFFCHSHPIHKPTNQKPTHHINLEIIDPCTINY
jgi:hypothetical protein